MQFSCTPLRFSTFQFQDLVYLPLHRAGRGDDKPQLDKRRAAATAERTGECCSNRFWCRGIHIRLDDWLHTDFITIFFLFEIMIATMQLQDCHRGSGL